MTPVTSGAGDWIRPSPSASRQDREVADRGNSDATTRPVRTTTTIATNWLPPCHRRSVVNRLVKRVSGSSLIALQGHRGAVDQVGTTPQQGTSSRVAEVLCQHVADRRWTLITGSPVG